MVIPPSYSLYSFSGEISTGTDGVFGKFSLGIENFKIGLVL
jgi:hypothetical protein